MASEPNAATTDLGNVKSTAIQVEYHPDNNLDTVVKFSLNDGVKALIHGEIDHDRGEPGHA